MSDETQPLLRVDAVNDTLAAYRVDVDQGVTPSSWARILAGSVEAIVSETFRVGAHPPHATPEQMKALIAAHFVSEMVNPQHAVAPNFAVIDGGKSEES